MKRTLDLSSVLIAMPYFHCADPRDKFYGILSLVDWNENHPVPVPDYNKNSFEVAVEVLTLVLADRRKSYEVGIGHDALIRWARHLWSLFELSLPHGNRKKYMKIRSIAPRLPFTFRQEPQRTLDAHWYGVQLPTILPSPLNDRVQIRYPIRPSRQEPYVELVDRYDAHFAYAPRATRPDDWLLLRFPSVPSASRSSHGRVQAARTSSSDTSPLSNLSYLSSSPARALLELLALFAAEVS